ncbi:hypothetical protein [Ohtaekwangia koreensis]|uniref:Uncharacterized protein n=1 Tax=Ohtaekwangia koreensis TaxID=688867 RepID=A0A1T5IRT3_9BACT|nr:hypothetical protein [Ohtaekwangia koreensis]SKC41897.1 hypothetical protein SAMN05660236_0330 [Ohtaekwangia koreensis]
MAPTKSILLNPKSNLKEAFWVFLSLAIIGAINLGQQWEERRFSVEYFTAELQCMLKLDQSQTQQMQQINYDFYDKTLKAYTDNLFDASQCSSEIQMLREKRDATMLQVLNDKQKSTWKTLFVYTNCRN